jgi:hypothetical protein
MLRLDKRLKKTITHSAPFEFSRTFVAPLVAIDPTAAKSKINAHRWSDFLVDIKNESVKFKEILQRTFSDRQKVNSEFAKCAQISFNAIHNVRRSRPPEDDGVFRPLNRRGPDIGGQPIQPLANPTQPRPKPARAMAASRFFAPEKLKAVYGLEPKQRDTFVVAEVQVGQGDAT